MKKDTMQEPFLSIPNYDKDFVLYTFSSYTSYVVVLTQKGQENEEFPIALMRSLFQNAEMKYPKVYKNYFVVFKALKCFRRYILKLNMKVIVPYPIVNNMLVEKELVLN